MNQTLTEKYNTPSFIEWAKNRSKGFSKRDIGKRNVKRKHRSRRIIFSHFPHLLLLTEIFY